MSFELRRVVLFVWNTASQYGKGSNISVSRLRYLANHNVLDSWPIRANLASQNDDIFLNLRISERRSNNNVQYNKSCVFLTLKKHKHIALHQIHKIMLSIPPLVYLST